MIGIVSLYLLEDDIFRGLGRVFVCPEILFKNGLEQISTVKVFFNTQSTKTFIF